ncbi:alpha/beta-hydrolase [Coccomyxa subellipsoidea C-169]|uniref:Alpha/beta-hydrolase n=1 Tax=Coccomyxa subellipsoidea (strain C-169) TaxID=574566 RepID=I0YIS2_COCSC|nr:alpha/beta-hydrolase [Coccomyxa subellipsoidea C-169]EIE18291.1 alpha/beta-hydrolase [Coccomyxa subellipsoidea C-169]|eukprot:XP_005642835.1 alpha/beta-hydrolase [Coccomyxa subellipsoidea C-169]
MLVPPRTLPEIVGGWLKYFTLITFVAVPIWAYQGFLALLGVTLGREVFFSNVDRSAMKFKDPFDLEHGFVTVNGLRLHTVSAGRGHGKPLMLFLHGFPELWFSWRRQMQQFKEDYEVVAVDMRGYGESDKPEGRHNYTIPTLASDTAALIKALGHERCVLVAHDWGGMVAWHTAALYPQAVERLVVMGLPHPASWRDNLDLDQFRRSWYMLFFQAPKLPEFLALAADAAFISGAFKTAAVAPRNKDAVSDEDVERYKQGFARPGAATASINYYRAFFDSETRSPQPEYRKAHELLRRGLKMPVLMLYAANDTALGPQLVRGTEKYVPDLELHVLEDCSHWVQQDQPELVQKLMRGFLERTAKSMGQQTVAQAA